MHDFTEVARFLGDSLRKGKMRCTIVTTIACAVVAHERANVRCTPELGCVAADPLW